MIIIPLARFCFLCVSRYYRGKDGTGIYSRDVILVIGDILDILSDSLFCEDAFMDTVVKKQEIVSVRENLE